MQIIIDGGGKSRREVSVGCSIGATMLRCSVGPNTVEGNSPVNMVPAILKQKILLIAAISAVWRWNFVFKSKTLYARCV